jgi:hypothetical protein
MHSFTSHQDVLVIFLLSSTISVDPVLFFFDRELRQAYASLNLYKSQLVAVTWRLQVGDEETWRLQVGDEEE